MAKPTTSNSRERSAWTAAHGLCYTRDMTIKRLDHVSVVVDDLAAAIAFFTALGMTIEGETPVEGPWVDRVNGLESVQVDIVMMRTPDGHGRLELTKFRNPKLVEIEPAIAPPNTLGLRSVMFTVESVDDTVARLRANGAELVGEVAQYEDKYRLCYMRGPAGIIVALAEELSEAFTAFGETGGALGGPKAHLEREPDAQAHALTAWCEAQCRPVPFDRPPPLRADEAADHRA